MHETQAWYISQEDLLRRKGNLLQSSCFRNPMDRELKWLQSMGSPKSIIHSPQTETVFTKRPVSKWDVAIYEGSASHKVSIDKMQGGRPKRLYILYDSIYMKILENAKL